jgi:drug/metabolite transporter (DMT)-like permease
MCVQKILQVRYSSGRLLWLIGAMSLNSLLYLSSEEIWKVADGQSFPEVSYSGFVFYTLFFLSVLISANYLDIRRIALKKTVAVSVTIISIAVDISAVSFSEFLVLYTIQVLPQSYLHGIVMLLLGAMPACMGSTVLSSLTADTLKKRAEKLLKDVKEISGQVASLEKQRKKIIEDLKPFEARKRKFERHFKKENKDDDEREQNDRE